MNVTVSARHCAIPSSIKERTTARLARLARFDERITGAEVVFDFEHGDREAEVHVQRPGRAPVIARAAGSTFRAAFGVAIGRVERQIKRERGRYRRRRHVDRRSEATTFLEEPPTP